MNVNITAEANQFIHQQGNAIVVKIEQKMTFG